jgi:hypothetical protein
MKIYEHTKDEKLQLQLKFELNLSYRKNQRIYTVNRLVQEFPAPNVLATFSIQNG